ncbi:Nop14-like family [Fragilaria crotonensis]|nr:Nop14-like family [Fragilaria crotonensis]
MFFVASGRPVYQFTWRRADGSEPEAFSDLVDALLALNPRSKTNPIPQAIADKIAATASKLSTFLSTARVPLTRRSGPSRQEMSIKSLAPRLEDPDRYRMSKDQGKNANQAALDRSRREYKREHKAVARELRMDGAFAEQERRREQDKRDSKARAKRNKNFAWLESEQGAMNQQVAQGGGLLSGGGMGAARAKAKSAKLGIKKGGKF